jgi:hypothetical protein
VIFKALYKLRHRFRAGKFEQRPRFFVSRFETSKLCSRSTVRSTASSRSVVQGPSAPIRSIGRPSSAVHRVSDRFDASVRTSVFLGRPSESTEVRVQADSIHPVGCAVKRVQVPSETRLTQVPVDRVPTKTQSRLASPVSPSRPLDRRDPSDRPTSPSSFIQGRRRLDQARSLVCQSVLKSVLQSSTRLRRLDRLVSISPSRPPTSSSLSPTPSSRPPRSAKSARSVPVDGPKQPQASSPTSSGHVLVSSLASLLRLSLQPLNDPAHI